MVNFASYKKRTIILLHFITGVILSACFACLGAEPLTNYLFPGIWQIETLLTILFIGIALIFILTSIVLVLILIIRNRNLKQRLSAVC